MAAAEPGGKLREEKVHKERGGTGNTPPSKTFHSSLSKASVHHKTNRLSLFLSSSNMRCLIMASALAATAAAIGDSAQSAQPLDPAGVNTGNPPIGGVSGHWNRGPGRPFKISNWTSTEYLLNYNSVLQTINSYPHYYDLGNYQAVGNLYTPDGCADFPILNNSHVCGPDAIAKFNAAGSKKEGAVNITLPTQHTFTNPDIRFDESGAAYVVVYLSEAIYGQFKDGMVTQARGYYSIFLTKTSDGPYYPSLEWLITSSVFYTFVSRRLFHNADLKLSTSNLLTEYLQFPPDGYPAVPRPNPSVYAVDNGAEW